MKDLLLNFGCSFTYGEGLEFHYWKDNYPKTFELYRNKVTYYPSSLIMISLEELISYREKNRYSGILKNFLNFNLLGKSENGGNNYRNIERLELLINYIKIETNYVPKYCVFQFTNIVRDILEFTHNPHGYNKEDDGVKWLGVDKKKEVVESLNLLDDPMRRTGINQTVADVFFVVFGRLVENFRVLESMGCKCVFFMGLEDFYSYHLVEETIKSNEFYMPIIFNGHEYRSWDAMNKDCYLTLKQNIGINDDHPCLDSHKWLANQLYKKYLQLTR